MLLSTADFGHVARGVLLFGVYLLMSEVCMSASNMVAEDSSYLMTRKLSDALQNRVKRTEAIAFEKEDTLNEIRQLGRHRERDISAVSCRMYASPDCSAAVGHGPHREQPGHQMKGI